MARVLVLPNQGSQTELRELALLIAQLTCAELVATPNIANELTVSATLPQTDVLVVLLGSEHATPGGMLDGAVAAALRYGTRIVGVWLRGITNGDPPPQLMKFGAALIPWDLNAARRAICEEEPEWVGADGGRAPKRPFKRNKC